MIKYYNSAMKTIIIIGTATGFGHDTTIDL